MVNAAIRRSDHWRSLCRKNVASSAQHICCKKWTSRRARDWRACKIYMWGALMKRS
jgi:hypothetical protein